MTLTYNRDQQMEYLRHADRIGLRWVDVFEGNTEFYSAAYWDLLTRLWRQGEPVRKTEALKFMKGIRSPHTAGKYMEIAIAHGMVVETANPEDARSKLVALSDDMTARLDSFFDAAVGEIQRTNRILELKGQTEETV